jgi:hypothetical protein
VTDLKEQLQEARDEIQQLRSRDTALQEAVSGAFSDLQRVISRESNQGQSIENREASPRSRTFSASLEPAISLPSRLESHTSSNTQSLTMTSGADVHLPMNYTFQEDLENLEVEQQTEGLSFSLPLTGWFDSTISVEHSNGENIVMYRRIRLTAKYRTRSHRIEYVVSLVARTVATL